MYKRAKKNCVIDIGEKEYGFNFEYEEALYLYHCGQQLKRKQWKKLKEEDMADGCSYIKWRQHIIKKYSNMWENDNFRAYIRLQKGLKSEYLDFSRELMNAWIPVVLTILATESIDYFERKTNAGLTNVMVQNIIFTILIIIIGINSLNIVAKRIAFDVTQKRMYEDIYNILNNDE